MKLQGIYIDAATPFDHAGELYRVKIEHNIGKWNQTSVAGYVIGGFAGEGPLLSELEKDKLWEISGASAGSGKALIAGVDAEGVPEAAEMANRAAGHGFAAALVETPHYDKLLSRQEVQLLYFRSVADRSQIPILISHRPAATGITLSPDTLQTLSLHPNVSGVVNHAWQSAKKLGDVTVLCGAEGAIWNALSGGAAGAVLGFANAAPYACIALWEAYRTREEAAGLDWQSRIAPPAALINDRFGVAGLKHAMDVNGFYGGPPRLPWSGVRLVDKREIERAFADLKS